MGAPAISEIIDLPGGVDQGGDLGRGGEIDAVRHAILGRQLRADDEVAAAGRAQCRDQVEQQGRAAGEIATITILAHIGARGEELVEEMAVTRRNLDPGKAGLLKCPGGLDEFGDHPLDLTSRERMRHGAAEIVGQGRGAECIGIAETSPEAATVILDLAEHQAAMFAHGICPARQFAGIDAEEDRRASGQILPGEHCHRLADQHRGAAPGAIGVIVDQARCDPAGRRIMSRHGCVDDAVAQGPRADRHRRKEMGVGGHGWRRTHPGACIRITRWK